MRQSASFLPLVAIALLFWLMVVRPASRRHRAVAQFQADLQTGQRVILTSGIYGTVRSLEADRARVEIAPNTEIEIARAAIGAFEAPVESTPEPTNEEL